MSKIMPINVEQCIILEIFRSLPIKTLITKKDIIKMLKKDHGCFINDSKLRKYIADIKNSNKELMIISNSQGYYVTDDPEEKILEMKEIIDIHGNIVKKAHSDIAYYENLTKKEL